MTPTLLSYGSGEAVLGAVMLFLVAAYAGWVIVSLVGIWKVFDKAGRPGWAALIPFYNLVVLFQIGGLSGWWAASILLAVIPFVGGLAVLGILIWLHIRVAERFGQGVGFAIGLTLLSPIFWCILGFGNYQYQNRPEIPQAA